MPEFNRAELRALLVATALLALGVTARLGLGPGPAAFHWESASPAERQTNASAVHSAVVQGIELEETASRPLKEGERLDPNVAPPEELRRLPGIGPARAAAIVQDRLLNGPYRTLSDLARVPGIGPASTERLAPHLYLPGPRALSLPTARLTVDVNRAQINDLEQITGIGPALARRIVDTRNRIGGFRSVDDLLEVPGIGPRNLQRIRSQVRVR